MQKVLTIKKFLCCWCVLSFTLVSAQPTGWEWDYLRKLEKNRTVAGVHFNQFISDAADPVGLAVPFSFFLQGCITKNKATKTKGIYLAQSFATNVAITYLMKKSIQRKRPGETDPTFTVLTPAGSRSFPSGHTSEAFAMATSLSLVAPKWYVITPAYAFAGLVGYSRMYLGAHYPTDVMAGALVGSAAAWVSYRINQRWTKKKSSARLKEPIK
jgi:membrane-associated phospholipid phosphatase